MKLSFLTCSLLLISNLAAGQTNRDDLTPLEISYTTRVSQDLKSLQIQIVLNHNSRPTIHLAMPSWTPGAYRIGGYGDDVQDLEVRGADGTALELTRMDRGTWSVACGGHSKITATYTLPTTRRQRFGRRPAKGKVTGLNVSGPNTYLYVRGQKATAVDSYYEIPQGWRIANGLLPTGTEGHRYARDYDTFIDAPTILGIFEERHFDVNGTPFSCVFFENAQKYDFDIDAFVDIVRRIVTNEGKLYGSFSFGNYVFLFTLPGGGGLEHLNSTSIGLNAAAQKKNPEAGASVTAHEFFHNWNVKRIRPKVLGPFDYQRENYTGNLWVSEGWTSYFGDLTLARIGVLNRDEYLEHLSGIIGRELNKERRKDHSVYWASRNVWHRFAGEEGARVDYYGTGELLGALIDLKIRHETDNKKSLNDVMRFLNRWFAQRGVGFEETDIERACTAISNYDFGEFFARHVYGTIDPPLKEYFAYAGLDYGEEVVECSFPFAIRGNRIGGRRRRGNADGPGPRPGETIQAIDGKTFADANAFLRAHAPGDVIKLSLESDGKTRVVEATLNSKQRMIPTLRYAENISDMQRRIRESWLSSER